MVARRPAENRRLLFWAGAFVGLVCAAIVALGVWSEWRSRSTALESAKTGTANVARSMMQHAEDSIELADTTLTGIVNQIEADDASDAAFSRIQSLFYLRKSTLGRIRALFVYGEDGRWLATTETVDLEGRNNADRDYFRYHRQNADRKAHIDGPVKSRSSGEWIITVSRRINHPDGTFAGVAMASIDVSYFSDFYRQFDVGAHGALSLLNATGIMLARNPADGNYVGHDFSASPLFKNHISTSSEGTYTFISPLDALERFGFFERSERYPVVVLATEALDDVLKQWRREAFARMGSVFALTVLVGIAGLHLMRQLAERNRMQAALVAKEADFRLLAEASGDMVARIGFDYRFLYVSPSSVRVVGWEPEDLLEVSALDGLNVEDRPRVEATLAELKRGERDEAKIIYRTRHREKTEIWLESALRVTTDPETGEFNGVVAISRDMTEHKDLQDRLAALATTDSLTALANRRCFDELLQKEWARSRRDRAPLSLLLIDIDHFKKFNDAYGHQLGDACLRRVAQTTAAQVQRSTDLVARYGGEEFVLVLPNTDSHGCKKVGERIRLALHALNIPHSESSPSKVVTVSIGGATAWPSASPSAEPESLIEAADRALYAAKDGGRDRLVMSGQVVKWPGLNRA